MDRLKSNINVGNRKSSSTATVFLICDVQDKFSSIIPEYDRIVKVSARLAEFATIMGKDYCEVYGTEQYPEKLGPTNAVVKSKIGSAGGNIFSKNDFTMATSLPEEIVKNFDNFVIVGLETHICVLQTCLDLKAEGKNVYLCVDGVGSRVELDNNTAISRLSDAGIIPTTHESLIFDILRSKNNPKFREASSLIKQVL